MLAIAEIIHGSAKSRSLLVGRSAEIFDLRGKQISQPHASPNAHERTEILGRDFKLNSKSSPEQAYAAHEIDARGCFQIALRNSRRLA